MRLAKGKVNKTVKGTADLKIKNHPEYDVPVWVDLNAEGEVVGVEVRGYYTPAKGDQLTNHDILKAREVVGVEIEEVAEEEAQ